MKGERSARHIHAVEPRVEARVGEIAVEPADEAFIIAASVGEKDCGGHGCARLKISSVHREVDHGVSGGNARIHEAPLVFAEGKTNGMTFPLDELTVKILAYK